MPSFCWAEAETVAKESVAKTTGNAVLLPAERRALNNCFRTFIGILHLLVRGSVELATEYRENSGDRDMGDRGETYACRQTRFCHWVSINRRPLYRYAPRAHKADDRIE